MMSQQEAKELGAMEVGSAGGRARRAGVRQRWLVTELLLHSARNRNTARCVHMPSPTSSRPTNHQVTTEHVLLGLISEAAASKAGGFLNSGLTPDRARAAVEALGGRGMALDTGGNIPFSREVRKTFEAATSVSGRAVCGRVVMERS
jgi:ATP-dependent Clp protease ATP-binding subunit ClpC